MSERTRNDLGGTPVAFAVGISARRPDLRRGVDAHLHGGAPAGGARVSAAPRWHGGGNPGSGSRVYVGTGRPGGSPEWYRRLVLSATGASGVALVVIYLA